MSTNLKTIKAVAAKRYDRDAFVKLTTFSGGMERGMCTQIAITGDGENSWESAWISLDMQGVRALRDQLEAIVAGNYKQYEGD